MFFASLKMMLLHFVPQWCDVCHKMWRSHASLGEAVIIGVANIICRKANIIYATGVTSLMRSITSFARSATSFICAVKMRNDVLALLEMMLTFGQMMLCLATQNIEWSIGIRRYEALATLAWCVCLANMKQSAPPRPYVPKARFIGRSPASFFMHRRCASLKKALAEASAFFWLPLFGLKTLARKLAKSLSRIRACLLSQRTLT